jgi:hypothetical protein
MTRHAPLWQQALTYPAQADRSLLAALWPAGAGTGGALTAVNNTMDLSIVPGGAAVPLAAGLGAALCAWDAAETLTLAAADPTNPRIDLVAVLVRDPEMDAGANNDWVFAVVKGVAAAAPVVPATPANALAWYQVQVPAGAANLNTATLTDRRPKLLAVPPAARFDSNWLAPADFAVTAAWTEWLRSPVLAAGKWVVHVAANLYCVTASGSVCGIRLAAVPGWSPPVFNGPQAANAVWNATNYIGAVTFPAAFSTLITLPSPSGFALQAAGSGTIKCTTNAGGGYGASGYTAIRLSD